MIGFKNSVISLGIFQLLVSSFAAPSLKILAGEDADIKDFPYMVNLHDKYEFLCGASILNENTVVTAAHCTLDMDPQDLFIGFGSANLSELSFTNVSQIFIHENFIYRPPFADDISIIKVDPPFKFSDTLRAVKLPTTNEATPGDQIAILTGWGQTEKDYKEIILQKVNLTILSDQKCEDEWKDTESPSNRTHKLCAQADMSDGVRRGQCSGDSGGPLVLNGTQYGIVSYHYLYCGNPDYPPIFTKVSGYVDWLSDKLLI